MELDRKIISKEVFVLTLEPEDMADLLSDLGKIPMPNSTVQAIKDEFVSLDKEQAPTREAVAEFCTADQPIEQKVKDEELRSDQMPVDQEPNKEEVPIQNAEDLD